MQNLTLRLPADVIKKLEARAQAMAHRRPGILRTDVAREIIVEFFIADEEAERRRACEPPPDTPK